MKIHHQIGIDPTSIPEQQVGQLQIAIVGDGLAGGSSLQAVLFSDQIVDEQQQLSAPHHELIQFDLVGFREGERGFDDHQQIDH